MSKGMAPAGTSSGGAKTNSAAGSRNRLMSHADAMRSTWGRGRVAHRRAWRGAGGGGRGGGGGAPCVVGGSDHGPLGGFARWEGLLAARSIEEVDVGQSIELAREARHLLRRANAAASPELPVAVRQRLIVRI